MNPVDVFTEVKELIEKKDIQGAQHFIEEHKNELGNYLEQAKYLLEGNEVVGNLLDKVSGLFGK